MEIYTISHLLLKQMLESEMESKILILDCRPFLAFNKGHILGSINVFCPPILKRRAAAKGCIRLESVLPLDIRHKVKSGCYTGLVLYSDTCEDNLEINMILQGLGKYSHAFLTVNILQGGFGAFKTKYPNACHNLKPACENDKDDSNKQRTPTRENSQTGPAQLLPHLYIGNENHSKNSDLLRNTGITAILNVSSFCPSHMTNEFQYKYIPVRDDETENISSWFSEALQFIDAIRQNDGKVLVHCKAGISRSATICIAYLMHHKSHTFDQAFEHVRSRRTVISPNMSFMQQLFDFENFLVMKMSKMVYPTSMQSTSSLSSATASSQ